MSEYISMLTPIQFLLDSELSETEVSFMFLELDISATFEHLAST